MSVSIQQFIALKKKGKHFRSRNDFQHFISRCHQEYKELKEKETNSNLPPVFIPFQNGFLFNLLPDGYSRLLFHVMADQLNDPEFELKRTKAEELSSDSSSKPSIYETFQNIFHDPKTKEYLTMEKSLFLKYSLPHWEIIKRINQQDVLITDLPDDKMVSFFTDAIFLKYHVMEIYTGQTPIKPLDLKRIKPEEIGNLKEQVKKSINIQHPYIEDVEYNNSHEFTETERVFESRKNPMIALVMRAVRLSNIFPESSPFHAIYHFQSQVWIPLLMMSATWNMTTENTLQTIYSKLLHVFPKVDYTLVLEDLIYSNPDDQTKRCVLLAHLQAFEIIQLLKPLPLKITPDQTLTWELYDKIGKGQRIERFVLPNRVHFISYGTKNMEEQGIVNHEIFKHIFSSSTIYSPEYLMENNVLGYSPELYNKSYPEFSQHHAHKRGCSHSFWRWKPFVILHHLSLLQDDDILFYQDINTFKYPYLTADSSVNMVPLIHKLMDSAVFDILILYESDPDLLIRNFCRKDLFDKIQVRKKVFGNVPLIQGNRLFIRKTGRSMNIVKEWLNYCLQDEFIFPPSFIPETDWEKGWHTHDQAILQLTLCKQIQRNRLLRMPIVRCLHKRLVEDCISYDVFTFSYGSKNECLSVLDKR